MASVSSWADRARNSHPETGPWHYVDIPIGKGHLDMQRDCAKGDCVVAKIEEFRGVLRDPSATPEKRREALMYIIHLVGDMHQPLHSSDNHDRGGNEVRTQFNERTGNLHALWDGVLLARMGNEQALYPKLSADAERHRRKWSKGTVRDWADSTHKAAKKTVYGKLPKLKHVPAPSAQALASPTVALTPVVIGAGYEQKADPLIAQQIEKAGVRLASVLNASLQ
jgi:hypothetical protein